MSLFDSLSGNEKTNQKEKNLFEPIIIETTNVTRELKAIAATHKLKPTELSFKLLKVTTFYSDEKNDEKEVDEKEKKLFLDDAFLLNPTLKLFQHYKIEIYKPDKEESTVVLPKISLSANKNLTKVVALIAKDPMVNFNPKLEEKIIEDIHIKKIKAGILVGIRDEQMYKEVKRIVASVRVNGLVEQDYSFVVCQGVDEVQPIHDNLVFHYKKKIDAQKTKDGRIDHSKRGFISPVEKDECVIEYIKPQTGTPGRNCRGVFLPVKEPRKDKDIPINTTANIVKKENDTSVKYIAMRGGYVNVDKGVYDVRDQMEINEISFRSTGSIDASINSNITINIKEKDALKDAVGAGMNVETKELNVEGNVGSGAKIKAKIVNIGGATHQSSYIESDKITISVHRGEANGQEIMIDRLEGGSVNGENVHIKTMIGGEVVGKYVKIDVLMSNAKITASEIIEITELKGSDNKLIIDPSITKEFNEEIESVNKKIAVLEEELKAYPRQLANRKDIIDKNKPMAQMVKDKITELKSSGVEPPITLYAKIKDFQEKVTKYNFLLQTFKDKKEQLSEFKQELNAIQTKVFSAKIINHSLWKEYNEIRFRLISPPKDITYNPRDKEPTREMMLIDKGDGEYAIVRSNEYSK